MIIAAVLTLMGFTAVNAQERMSEEERAKAIAERIEKAGERMAKDFGLKGDKRDAFVATFTAYQQEMFATNQPQGRRDGEADAEKKDLTDEEATAKIQEGFDRQARQIATLQKRLDTQKKYAEEFSKVLTPQQVLKLMTPQRQQGQRGQGQRGQGQGGFRGQGEGGPRGGFGGGRPGGFGGGGFGGGGF